MTEIEEVAQILFDNNDGVRRAAALAKHADAANNQDGLSLALRRAKDCVYAAMDWEDHGGRHTAYCVAVEVQCLILDSLSGLK